MSLISVVVPVKNNLQYLPQALDSVVVAAKDFDTEIILIDDGSTEDIKSFAKNYPFPIRYYRQKNKGASFSRNRGVRLARGEYLAFIDSDDIWHKNHLKVLLKVFAKNPGIQIARGSAQRFYESLEKKNFYEKARVMPTFGSSLSLPTAFKVAGPLDRNLRFHEDTEWFIRARDKGVKMKSVSQVVVYYRLHQNNTTRDVRPTDKIIFKIIHDSLVRRRRNEK